MIPQEMLPELLLQEKLDKLQKNEAGIPKEILQTKYAKPYNALLAEIRRLYNIVLQQELFYFSYPEDFVERGKALVCEQFEQRRKELAAALFCSYSAEEYIRILREMNSAVLGEFFSSEHTINGIGFSINPWMP